jgi:hypothetical protein
MGGNMTNLNASQLRHILCRCTLLIAVIFPVSALADTWQLQVGAQNGDKASGACLLAQRDLDSFRR